MEERASLEGLRSELREQRAGGEVVLAVEERGPGRRPEAPTRSLDAFVAGLGYRPIDEGWREIHTGQAGRVLRRILTHDLAHGSEIMPPKRAAELAERFLDLCGAGRRYFTNGEPPGGRSREWSPLTEATFDAGVAVLGADRIGILWVEDED